MTPTLNRATRRAALKAFDCIGRGTRVPMGVMVQLPHDAMERMAAEKGRSSNGRGYLKAL